MLCNKTLLIVTIFSTVAIILTYRFAFNGKNSFIYFILVCLMCCFIGATCGDKILDKIEKKAMPNFKQDPDGKTLIEKKSNYLFFCNYP